MGDVFTRRRELLCVKWRSVCISVYVQLVVLCVNCMFERLEGLVIFLACFPVRFWDIILSSLPCGSVGPA